MTFYEFAVYVYKQFIGFTL